MRLLIAFVCYLVFASNLMAQQGPKSNVYLFEIQQLTDSVYQFNEPLFLTAFNKSGYNNQPAFFRDNQLYMTVQLSGAPNTEIYKFDLDNKTKVRVTNTVESEYSPTLMPDYYSFSAVRVEADANKTQRLWSFPMDRSNNGKALFPNTKGVGYHCWIDQTKVALFMVSDPNYLAIGDTRSNEVKKVASNVGRCLQKLSNGNLAYVQKATPNTWYIKELDVRTGSSKILMKTLSNSEDFVITNDGTFLMGQGSRLYKYHPRLDKAWLELVDLRYYNIGKITRMALSFDNKLAIVGE